MKEMVSRLLWIVVTTVTLSYATYLVAGSIVHAQGSRENQPIIIRDELEPGVHHLSGMVMVPTPCDQLSVRIAAISSSMYTLLFRTWREPSVECNADEMPRYFRTIVFAPSVGVQFTATLDGAGFPIVVMPALPGRAPFDI